MLLKIIPTLWKLRVSTLLFKCPSDTLHLTKSFNRAEHKTPFGKTSQKNQEKF